MEDYELIRSKRKTVQLRLREDGVLQVRAPLRMPRWEIEEIISRHDTWLRNARERQRVRQEQHPEPTEEQREECIRRAKAELPPLVEHYAALMGVTPAGITVTSARTRWGSCSGKNRLSFTWRLMLYPNEAVEAVVVHELAHIRHKDHQKGFYDEVLGVLPDYYERMKLLK